MNRRPSTLSWMMVDLLKDSAAAHKRRRAIKQGRREADTSGCNHDWDTVMQWCQKCGLTKQDMMENPPS